MTFERALNITLGYEGGEVDDPVDRGGHTKWGVTQATYDEYRDHTHQPRRSVHEMTTDEMRDLYFAMYWLPGHCEGMPEKLACAHFDARVNHSPAASTKMLQRAVCAVPDGCFGPETQADLNECLNLQGESWVIDRQLAFRDQYFDQIVANNPDQQRFIKGWHNRVKLLRAELL